MEKFIVVLLMSLGKYNCKTRIGTCGEFVILHSGRSAFDFRSLLGILQLAILSIWFDHHQRELFRDRPVLYTLESECRSVCD